MTRGKRTPEKKQDSCPLGIEFGEETVPLKLEWIPVTENTERESDDAFAKIKSDKNAWLSNTVIIKLVLTDYGGKFRR
jgi:hypothetical protein